MCDCRRPEIAPNGPGTGSLFQLGFTVLVFIWYTCVFYDGFFLSCVHATAQSDCLGATRKSDAKEFQEFSSLRRLRAGVVLRVLVSRRLSLKRRMIIDSWLPLGEFSTLRVINVNDMCYIRVRELLPQSVALVSQLRLYSATARALFLNLERAGHHVV